MRDAVLRVYLAFNQFRAGHYDSINVGQTCENKMSNTPMEEIMGEDTSSIIILECLCDKMQNVLVPQTKLFVQSQTRIHQLKLQLHSPIYDRECRNSS